MSFVQADFPFQYDKCACIYIVPVRIRKNDENSLGIQQFHWNSSSNFYAVSATVSPFKVSLTFSLSQSLFLSLSSCMTLFYKHTNTTNMLDLRSRFSIVCKQFSYIFSNQFHSLFMFRSYHTAVYFFPLSLECRYSKKLQYLAYGIPHQGISLLWLKWFLVQNNSYLNRSRILLGIRFILFLHLHTSKMLTKRVSLTYAFVTVLMLCCNIVACFPRDLSEFLFRNSLEKIQGNGLNYSSIRKENSRLACF